MSTSLGKRIFVPVLFALVLACGSAAPKQPPGVPPTPATVTQKEPGGDAFNPHHAALVRQLERPWGARNDKDDLLHAPTPDWSKWKRVKFRLVKHFTGFRYGKDHHVMALVFLLDVPPGSEQNTESCMRRFETWARPQVDEYDVTFGPFEHHDSEWRKQPLLVKSVDGHINVGFTRHEFSAAWAAYAAYPDACLIYAVAIPWDGEQKLAQAVRDRWVTEGFGHMRPLTKTRPHRLP